MSTTTTESWPLWIGGCDSDPSRSVAQIISPIDETVATTVQQASTADVDRALELAAAAQTEAAKTTRHTRKGWLLAAADAFDKQTDAFCETLIDHLGKPRRLSAAEAGRGSDLLRECAAVLGHLGGETLPLDAGATGAGRWGMTVREPLGVIATITPFNAPINLMMQKLAPALAMGNAVVVKPAPETAVVTLQVIAAIAEVFPKGLISVVCGGADIGEYLVSHPTTAAVSLTGGTGAGAAVLAASGIKPVLLELGSNAPNIVLADADLGDAAARISQAAFGASGQQCISAQRIIVEESVLDEFVELFTARAGEMVVGDPALATTDIGPVVHRRSRDRVVDLVDDAVAKGASVALDGRNDGLYLAPTILTKPSADARLLSEEVFGPVAVVISVPDVEAAIELANGVDLGLQGAVFTRNIDLALDVAARVRCGSMWINESSRFRMDTYPFGGMKRSGLGREGVRYAMEELSHLKFIGIRTGNVSGS